MLDVNKPATIYVRFVNVMPRTFEVYDHNGKLYYFRYLDGFTPRIKFNVPDAGSYSTNVPVDIVKVGDIEVPNKYPKLPPAVRDRWKEVKEWYNPDLDAITTTPIRIYTEYGVVEYGDRFLSYPKPIQIFLMEHEKGHFFYVSEEDCDMFALLNFLRMGYNQSTAYYALANILQRTPGNIERLKILFNTIQKIRQ